MEHFIVVILYSLFLISLVASSLLGILILPRCLNRHFDSQFSPSKSSERWRVGHNPKLPLHSMFRATDYSRAVLFSKVAASEFGVSRDYFRSRIGKTAYVLCWVHIITLYLGYIFLIVFSVRLLYAKLFLG